MVAGRLDRAATTRQRQYNEIAERMAARGLASSGARYSAQWGAAIDSFRDAMTGIVADYVQTANDFGLNADELRELFDRYRETVRQYANGLAAHAVEFTRSEPQLLRGCE